MNTDQDYPANPLEVAQAIRDWVPAEWHTRLTLAAPEHDEATFEVRVHGRTFVVNVRPR